MGKQWAKAYFDLMEDGALTVLDRLHRVWLEGKGEPLFHAAVTVAKALKVSERAIRESRIRLERQGWLVRLPNPGGRQSLLLRTPEDTSAPMETSTFTPAKGSGTPEDSSALPRKIVPVTPEDSSYDLDPIDRPKDLDPIGRGSNGLAPSVRGVFEYWVLKRDKSAAFKLTPKRSKVLKARMNAGWTVERLKLVIDGVAFDPWKDRPDHDDLTIIMREENAEKFEALALKGDPRTKGYCTDRGGEEYDPNYDPDAEEVHA